MSKRIREIGGRTGHEEKNIWRRREHTENDKRNVKRERKRQRKKQKGATKVERWIRTGSEERGTEDLGNARR